MLRPTCMGCAEEGAAMGVLVKEPRDVWWLFVNHNDLMYPGVTLLRNQHPVKTPRRPRRRTVSS